MTGLEFLANGIVLEPAPGGALRVKGPAGRADLLDQLRFEITTRLELVGDGDGFGPTTRTPWGCDVCGDQIGHPRDSSCPLCGILTEAGESRCSLQFGGTCVLCILARQKAVHARARA
jgi:hypothetical protein